MKKYFFWGVSVLSIIVFFLEFNSKFSIGAIINSFFPCRQIPENSFPCFGVYNIHFMIFLLILFIASIAAAIFFTLHRSKKS